MNLEQVRGRIRRVTGFTMPELYADADIESLVNEVYLDVCGTEDWPFLYLDQTETTDGAILDLPAPVRTFSSVVLDGDVRLNETTLDELDELDPDEVGRPELYARLDQDRLLLWPEPDETYTVRFRGWREPAALTQDADAPAFDTEFHPVLVYETAARILIEFGDFERVEGLRSQAADALSRMRVRYMSSKDRGLVQMGGRVRDRRRWTAR